MSYGPYGSSPWFPLRGFLALSSSLALKLQGLCFTPHQNSTSGPEKQLSDKYWGWSECTQMSGCSTLNARISNLWQEKPKVLFGVLKRNVHKGGNWGVLIYRFHENSMWGCEWKDSQWRSEETSQTLEHKPARILETVGKRGKTIFGQTENVCPQFFRRREKKN